MAGHLRGDEILSEVGAVVKRVSRAEDGCFRYGGGEFCIVLPNCTEERARDIYFARLRAEIESLEAGRADRLSWAERPLDELVRFIVDRYHSELRLELPELVALAEKVEDRHAEKSTCPRGLAAHLGQVYEAVLSHLAKEEEILFPMIVDGLGARAGSPIQVMEHEHLDHARNLRRTRELAHDFVPPQEACTTWQALYLRLDNLEAELMEHIHLENNVLFPRALSAGGGLTSR